jgi:PAS domain S-box-containing protein
MTARTSSSIRAKWFDRVAFDPRLVAVFVLGLAMLVTLSLLSWQSARQFRDTTRRAQRSRDVRTAIREIYSSVHDARTQMRGFLNTGREEELATYTNGLQNLSKAQQQLEVLTAGQPAQQQRLARLRELVRAYVDFCRQTIETRRAGGGERTAALTARGRDEEMVTAIRALVSAMTREEEASLRRHETASLAATQRLFRLLPAATVLALGFLLGAFGYLNAQQLKRRRAEQALRYRNAIIESSDDAIVGKTLEGVVTTWNRGAEKLFGYTREEMLGRPITVIFPPDRLDEELIILDRIKNGESLEHFETVRRRKDGTLLDISVTVSPIRDARGAIIGASKIARDITQRKRAEAALRRSEESARLLNRRLETLQHAVAQLAAARTLEDIMAVARTAARQLTGADGATFVLRDGDQCFYADEDAVAPLWKGRRFPMRDCISGWVMLHHQAVAIEDIYADPRIPADAYRPTFVKSLAMVPIRTAEPLGALGNYWADRHRTTPEEMDLLRALADSVAVGLENVQSYHLLEQRVRERTAQLEAANKELEAFSYSVSHDLRAPLRAVIGFGRILIEDHGAKLDEEGRRLVGVVQSEAQRMARLIDDLLAFSRLGRQQMGRTTVDMTALVRSVIESDAGGWTSDFQPPAFEVQPLPAASGDPAMLRQVVVNLISNAVKFSSRRESPRIEVGGWTRDGHHTYYVKDNGVGFDEKYRHKLFGVFQRLHGEAEFPGTGVGLALVQRVIHRHGGRVWAEGEPDKGATFYFSLPASAREPE